MRIANGTRAGRSRIRPILGVAATVAIVATCAGAERPAPSGPPIETIPKVPGSAVLASCGPATLQIEGRAGPTTCAEQEPWAFGAAAFTYVR
jgi:hypothetical protein